MSLTGKIVYPLALAAMVAALYAPTVHYPYHFDDHPGVLDNPAIRDISDIGGIWRHNPSRFLVFLSFAVNHRIGGYDTFSYHILNIAFHAAASIAFYYFLALLFRAADRLDGRKGDPDLTELCALAAAMVFAVHPLQTEAVTFIWQRSTSIAVIFYFATLAFYLKSAMAEQDGRPSWRPWLVLSAVSCLLAMLSKQFSVTLPLAVGLVELIAISGTLEAVRKRAARLAPFAPMIPLIPILTTLVTKGEIGDLGVRSDNLLPLYQYLITEFNVIVFVYLKLFFLPVNQNLDYDFPVSRSFLDSAPAFFILTSLLAAGVALHRRNRVASIGIILFFLTASVESSFFVLEDLVFEHRIYLPMAGLLAAMASVMRLGLEKAPANAGRAVAVLIILAVCVPLSIATGRRNLAWSSARGLMADVVAKSPRKVRGYNNLAAVIQSEGDADLALATLYKAKDINPRDPFTLMNIGRGLEKKGDIEALKYYLRAVSINPQLPGAAFELGDLLFRLKKFDGAAKYFTLAHNLKPWDIPTRMNLGVALYHGGRLKDAVRVFTSVLKMKPDQAEAHFNLSQAYLGLGETAKAEEHLSKATALGYTKPEPEK